MRAASSVLQMWAGACLVPDGHRREACGVSSDGPESVYDIEFRGEDKAHYVHNVVLWHMTR